MKSTIFALLLSATYAAAHGNLMQITIDGQVYNGNRPGSNPTPSVIRQLSENGPVKGANNPNLPCGMNAKNAELMADAMPGSTIVFNWRGGGDNNWPHAVGPMMTYLASCGSQSCASFDASQGKWFKISQIGRKADGTWAVADITKGGTTSVQLPSTLPPGNYLVRHELLALQQGNTRNGAEFYPSCAQIKVGGSQAGKISENELASFPGAYRDDDPGIYVPDIFNSQSNYVFPGPPLAAIVGGNGNTNPTSPTPTGGAPPSQTSNAVPSQTIAPVPPSSSSSAPPVPSQTGSGTCRLVARRADHEKLKRRISRIMRDLLNEEAY
ncbi:lytic polysaccharide monooxygenase [Amanita thiersii Skay4041]|uniref:lytic cellulose monooxygenase (C4-dehydrogenating) n=1 Tax=Amanita thiersii Skay4041 TaxID=703135 RepID=A0A2A9NMY5_9AGAR|nr:lytic polysaccharide monooxygenase [Amanita thiersii Skay4041]